MSDDPSLVTTLGTALVCFLFIIGFYAFREPEERRFLLPLGIAAFVVRAILVPTYYFVLVNEGLAGFEFNDSEKYHYQGIEFAREFERGIDYDSQAWRTRDPGFPILTGIVYWITGVNTLAVRLLNSLISAMTLLWVYRIAKLVFDDQRVARRACYLLAFLPYPIVTVISHRKDTLVAFLATYIFYQGIRVLRFDKNTTSAAIGMCLGLAAISVFRSGFLLPFIGTLFVCYLLTQRSPIQAIALSIPTVIILGLAQVFIGQDGSLSLAENTARLQGKLLRSGSLAEASGLVAYVRMTSLLEIYKLPFATALVTIMPFPPYIGGYLPSIVLSWTNLINLIFLPQMLVGAWMTVNSDAWRKRLPALLFPLVFLVLLAAIHVGIIRYRETIYPAMLVLAGAGLARGGNTVFAGMLYFALTMLGGIVLFVRYA